ncbi:hypothetical protein AV656_06710 [Bhargavaea cecembensis]|uniref:Fis family transcriptional regulator n=1 Tax=Bhargavaea cecembensis TaxID=394098 RepID=A0A163FR03_9BACL|nr:hypothetical protein AV656_06710 [Bhargavaea cecembensis]
MLLFCLKCCPLSSKDDKLYCLEKIIETIDEGVMMSNEEGQIVLYNEAQEKMEGLQANEILGKPLWEAYNYNPQYSEHRHVFNTGKPIFSRYRAHSRVAGVPKYVSYSTFPIQRDGKTIGVFSVSTNESKLKNQLYETIELKRSLTRPEEEKTFGKNGTIYTFSDIKGQSTLIKELLKEAQAVSVHNTDTLIVGETGTGKELFAQSMHNHSSRKDKPFVAINCAAIPENLLESTLFGTVKGAYTGATDQIGLFEYAQAGTLFLDEINSMPIALQAKLMRVLQERLVRRVGSNEVTPVRCTVISASNEDPEKLIREDRMRLDLFYRIANTSLIIPPLRDRPDDVLYFIDHFLDYFQGRLGKVVPPLSATLREALLAYQWPGNIRELEHLIQNIVIRVSEDTNEITADHLPSYIKGKLQVGVFQELDHSRRRPLKKMLNQSKKHLIESTLDKTDWNISAAARKLGITRQSLQYHIKKNGLSRT